MSACPSIGTLFSTPIISLDVPDADKLNADLRAHGKRTMARFNAGPREQLWFHGGVLRVMRATGGPGALLEAYAREVREFRRHMR